MASGEPTPPSENSYEDIDHLLDEIIEGNSDLKRAFGRLANQPVDTIKERAAALEREIVANESLVMDFLRGKIEGIEVLESATASLLIDNPRCLHVIGELADTITWMEDAGRDTRPVERLLEIAVNINNIASYMGSRVDQSTVAWMKQQIQTAELLSETEIGAFNDAVDLFIRDPKIRKMVDLYFTGTFLAGYDIGMYDENFITLKSLVQDAAVQNAPEIAEQGVDEILDSYNINKADYSRTIREIISLVREVQE